MSAPRLMLEAVQHISRHSIFFVPCENDHLDLKTVSTAPPAHRGVLQRNGLVAKVCVGVTLYEWSSSDAAAPAAISSLPLPTSGVAGSTGVAELESLSAEEREELWRSALTYAGLLPAKEAALVVSSEFAGVPWPVQGEESFTQRMQQLSARVASTSVNTCSACVPVLSIQEYVYKRKGVRVCLGVAWMPRYAQTLQQWAAGFAAPSSIPIPEYALLALLHHVSIGVLALRSGLTTAAYADFSGSGTLRLALDTILVDDAAAAAGGGTAASAEAAGDISFVLALGASSRHSPAAASAEPRRASENLRSLSVALELRAGSTSTATAAEQHLYRTPEECSPDLYPTRASGAGRRVVWALGVMLYLLASATATAMQAPRRRSLHRMRLNDEEVPLNAAPMTPDALWRRLRRQLEGRGYSSTLVTVAAQLLSLDPLTRPSLHAVERLLQDLHRPTPVRRFPFALGSYDLLRVPNPAHVHLNPGARRYSVAGVCVLCRRARDSTPTCTKGGEHETGTTSPSWCDDDVLPAMPCPASHYMTFLFPIVAASDERQQRRHLALVLQGPGANAGAIDTVARDPVPPIDVSLLLQVFGGFALYERKMRVSGKGLVQHVADVKEVLVPYPSQGLRRCEMPLVKATVDFTGGLPWPSACTELLQKGGRISRNVPFAFTGARQSVEWFAWVLPGERFDMPNGMTWTAPRDGAFVFWFDADLQPTDRDRYYALTSACAATLPAKLARTVMPDSIFRLCASDERLLSAVLASRAEGAKDGPLRAERSTAARPSSSLRRRSCNSITDVMLPFAGREIVEADEESTAVARSAPSLSVSRANSASERGPPCSTRRRRSTRKASAPSHRGSVSVVAVGGATGATAAAWRRRSVSMAAPVAAAGGEGTQTTTPHSATPVTMPLGGIRPPHTVPPKPTLTSAGGTPASLENDAPLPQQQPARRSAAQTPSHHDTSADSGNALGDMDLNEARSTRPDTTSLRHKKMLKKRLVAATLTEPPAGAADRADRVTLSTGCAPALLRPGSGGHGGVLRASRQRPLSRRDVGAHTPVKVATPKLPFLMRPATTPRGLSGLHVCGLWLPGHAMDAVFKALTFCVRTTGEHGYMQAPVKLSLRIASAVRAPSGAAFLAFLSNQVPLFCRNHAQLEAAGQPLLLPHHGFAFYDADGGLLGVLALRCSVRGYVDVLRGEFELDVHAGAALHGSGIAARTVYASYLSAVVPGFCSEADACLYGPRPESAGDGADDTAAPMLHVSALARRASASRSLLANSTPENTTLTFTSARHLVGDFTPSDRDALIATEEDAAATLPARWVGFDAATSSLLFTDAEQTAWVPYSIGA